MNKLGISLACLGFCFCINQPAVATEIPSASIGLLALGGGMVWPEGTTPAEKQKYYRNQNKSKYYRADTKRTSTNSHRASKKRHKAHKPKHRAKPIACPKTRQASGRRVFVFSPRKTTYCAYNEKGQLVKSGKASGGRNYCPDIKRSCRTPRGTFAVQRKGSAGCRSSSYPVGKGGAPMPYCTFFSKYYAIHGSHHVPRYNASHGCVRVTPSDARWLHKNFFRIGTKVIVTSY